MANFAVENINSNGILLRKIGDVFTYDKSANVIISTPHDEYLQQQNMINHCIEELHTLYNMSKHISNKNGINNIIFEFDSVARTINEMNKLISNPENRDKRALFPSVGTGFEYFFVNEIWRKLNGTNNEAILMSTTLFNHSERMVELIDTIQRKNNVTDVQISTIIEKLNQVVFYAEETVAKEARINNLIQILTLTIMRYKNFQNKIISFILTQEPSHVDPEIISLSFLHIILDEIEKKTNESSILPWKLFNEFDFLKWYKMIPMKISVISGLLITEISVPLVSIGRKELYEAIAVPVPFEKSLMYIKPEAPYFITDIGKNEIGYLTLKEFERCWETGKKEFICPKTFPMYLNQYARHFCELSILMNKKEIPNNCVTFSLTPMDLFMKMNESKCKLWTECHRNGIKPYRNYYNVQ